MFIKEITIMSFENYFPLWNDLNTAQIAEAEKIEIIPTLVLYRDGKAIDSIVAPESKIMIEKFINEALEK